MKGYYIEYVFCEGAPVITDAYHDMTRIGLIFYVTTIQRKMEFLRKKYLMRNKAHIDTRLSKIYELETFTCGHEENLELALALNKGSWESFHP